MTAIEQVTAFWALLIFAFWIAVYPHGDDGIEIPLRRLAERQAWASTIDPLIPKPSHD